MNNNKNTSYNKILFNLIIYNKNNFRKLIKLKTLWGLNEY